MEPNVYDRWVTLKVLHDYDSNTLDFWVDGKHKKTTKGKGNVGAKNYFKCGAYMNRDYGDEV
jgi:hypothetical protein